jgi:hypothetical protein
LEAEDGRYRRQQRETPMTQQFKCNQRRQHRARGNQRMLNKRQHERGMPSPAGKHPGQHQRIPRQAQVKQRMREIPALGDPGSQLDVTG